MNARVRTTISLDPETHEVFKRMAEASGESVSRCMGDWLSSTAEGAEFVTEKIRGIKRSPIDAVRAFKSDMLKASEFADRELGFLEKRDDLAQEDVLSAPPVPGRRSSVAPSSNTGLKSPKKGKDRGEKL
jgi:hypothetical protein